MKRPKSAIPVGPAPNRRVHAVGSEEVDLHDPTAAQRVKLAYGRERARWESIKAGKPIKYVFPSAYEAAKAITIEEEDGPVLEKARKSVWVKLAKWMDDNGIKSPESYIAFQFDQITYERKRALEPFQLMSADLLEQYLDTKKKIHDRVRVALVVQKQCAERRFWYYKVNGMEAEDAWACVLTDASLELSPLFRYCVAVGIGGKRFGRIAARFHADAILQFERYRGWYRKQWSALLPKGFAAESKRIYPHLLVR